MVTFLNNSDEEPYIELRKRYYEAFQLNENLIDVILIASYSEQNNEVDSRAVNLKIIDNNEFIFFSNYDSPKAKQFSMHDQITALFFWNSINVQIRIKATIKKSNKEFSNLHYDKRTKEKNALAHSSNQSSLTESYEKVVANYKKILKNEELLLKRPDNWGGFSFKPYYFEFWEGNNNRLNKREIYTKHRGIWVKSFLQP